MSPPDNSPCRIDSISTRTSIVGNPERFVMRYGKAIRDYIGALIRNVHDADDVSQGLLLQVLHKGLARAAPQRGRFRDYLKAVIRNVVADWFRRRGQPIRHGIDLDTLTSRNPDAERQWLADWRGGLLDAAWTALYQHQQRNPGNWCHSVLRLAVDRPEDDSAELAARLSQRIRQPMRPDAFRKQLSRARRLFARMIVEEVRGTLAQPDPRLVEEELVELGLLSYVRPFTPARGEG
jgi:DNA-directed RNA polymerase specialized sigma24 family protein